MPPNQSQDLRLLRQGLNKFAPIATALSGGLVWAYMIGWCYNYVYLGAFGASWVIYQIPASQLLFSSWLPIFIIAVGAAATSSMVHHEPIQRYERVHFKWTVTAIYALYFIALACLLALFLNDQTPGTSMPLVWSGEFFFLISTAVVYLAIDNKIFGWNAPSAGLSFLILFVTIVHIPMAKGAHDALSVSPGNADPPLVTLKSGEGGGSDMRLLLHANGLFYVAKGDTATRHREVLIFAAQDIASISGYPEPAAVK